MKIVMFEMEPWEREAIGAFGGEHEVVFVQEELTRELATEHADAGVVSTFIYSSLDRPVIEAFDRLKLIATRSTGYDHIDLDACRERGVRVCNVPSYGENTVAEHVFGLLLTISHRVYDAVERTRKGDFSQVGLRGFDLAGKTMGVVGTGAIGRHVVRIARGFDMEVVAFDIQRDEEFAERAGFAYVDLDELLERSDVTTLHVPLNEQTKGMISAEEFEKMKDGAVLINTSRGAVVNPKDLVRALADGTIAAAGLDVLPGEPVIREEAELLRTVFQKEYDLETLLADHVLLRLRNVYVTPHSAFNTAEGVGRILEVTRENIEAFCESGAKNLVAEPDEEMQREPA